MSGPIWPKVPAGFVRAVLAGHSSLGLFLAALAYLVCITGTVVVLADELRRWEQPYAPEVASMSPEAMDRAADAALARAEGKPLKSVTLYLPTEDRPNAIAWISGGKDFSKGWFIRQDGSLAQEDQPEWNHYLAELHASLHLERVGYVVVGLIGVMMLGLAVSGLLAHPRIFRDAFRFRWGGSRRLQEADLHNRLSVWGLPFNVIVSLTGAYIGLVSVLVLVLGAVAPNNDASKATLLVRTPMVKEDNRPAPRLSLGAAATAVANDAKINGKPFILTLNRPGTRGQSITVYSLMAKRLVYGELYHVGPDGALKRVGYSDGDFGKQLYASSYRLHFGNFGGLPVKLLYVALGVGLSVVTASGVSIWLARRRDQGRPAPGWERIWISTAWGLLISTSLSAGARFAFMWDPLTVFWAVQAAAWVTAFLIRDAARLSGRLRLALAASLLFTPAAHIARYGGLVVHPVIGNIDLLCVLVALALLVRNAGRRREAAAGVPALAE